MPSFSGCIFCNGMGCPQCAENYIAMKKIEARLKAEDDRAIREEAVGILYELARRSGQPFDDMDPRASNAIMLACDVLKLKRERDRKSDDAPDVPADTRGRFDMLEWSVPLKSAAQIDTPPWIKNTNA